jgi:hypothetical protein
MRHLLNLLVDGDGVDSPESASALALASLKFLDDIEEAVNSAASCVAEPCENAPSITIDVFCDCVD